MPAAEPGGPSPPREGGGERIRLLRIAHRLSQEQLARAAGISRQAVTGIESGRWDPSLRVALALARALEVSVEELVADRPPLEPVEAGLAEGLRIPAGQRVGLAEVGGRLVAVPRPAADPMGFPFADGVAVGQAAPHPGPLTTVRIRPLALRGPALVVAGCDPALPLLGRPLGALDPPIELVWWPCGSRRALQLARQGLVHAAGVHVRDRAGSYNRVAVRAALAGAGADVVGFAGWSQGWVLGPALEAAPSPLAAAGRLGLRLANRERGAEARVLLDRERCRAQIPADALAGYGSELPGHLPVAAAVATGLADLGVTTEPAALALGLAYRPLTHERFDLVLPRPTSASLAVKGLLRVLGGGALRAQLAELPGYDGSTLGRVVDTF